MKKLVRGGPKSVIDFEPIYDHFDDIEDPGAPSEMIKFNPNFQELDITDNSKVYVGNSEKSVIRNQAMAAL